MLYVTVTTTTINNVAGYAVNRQDKNETYFTTSLDELITYLYYNSDVVVTVIPEVIARLDIARIPYDIGY